MRRRKTNRDPILTLRMTSNRRKQRSQFDRIIFSALIGIAVCSGIILIMEFRTLETKSIPSVSQTQIPRVVLLLNEDMDVTPISSVQFPYHNHKINDCQPLVAWQHIENMNCNMFHELDFVSDKIQLINHGYIREVWNAVVGNVDNVALKTLIHDESFSESQMEGQAADANISDQLVASQHVANIYGYCKL